jgi:hypothetical protein
VDWNKEWSGKRKYEALVQDMASDCDILVHVGDTKAGGEECDEFSLTRAVHTLVDAGAAEGKMVLFAPGDNEVNIALPLRIWYPWIPLLTGPCALLDQ